MRVNGSIQSPDRAFYACLTEKGRGVGVASASAGLIQKHLSGEYHVRLGFVPCRNSLRNRSLVAAAPESSEVTSDLPGRCVRSHGWQADLAEGEAHASSERWLYVRGTSKGTSGHRRSL